MKKLFSPIEDYIVYNIIWSDKSNLFFTKTKSQLYLYYGFF